MNENTAKILETLAQKFGTTAEYLWQALLRQAPISATLSLFLLLVLVASGIYLYRLHRALLIKDDSERNAYDRNDHRSITMNIATVIWVCMAILGFGYLPQDILAGYFNPEYWALKQILTK